jgi:hypothetical protein
VSDDFQRLIVGDRRAYHLLDVPGVTYSQGVHNAPPVLFSRGWPVCARRRDISLSF